VRRPEYSFESTEAVVSVSGSLDPEDGWRRMWNFANNEKKAGVNASVVIF